MSCTLLLIERGSSYSQIWRQWFSETSKQWTHWREHFVSYRGCPYPGGCVFEPHINHMNCKLLIAHMSAHAAAEESSYHTVLPYWMLWSASNLHSHHRYFLNHCQTYVHSHSGVIRLLCSYSRVLTTSERNTSLTDVAMVCLFDGVQLCTLEMDRSGVNFSAELEESHSDNIQQLTLPSLSTLHFRANSNYCCMQEHDKVRWTIFIEDWAGEWGSPCIYP